MISIVAKKLLWASFALLVIIAAIAIGLGIGLGIGLNRPPAETINRHSGSVTANGHECAAIGGRILKELQGNAADAAIATVFCEGIAHPQSCGLGGGFMLTMYTKSTGKVITLNAREVAPQAATENMFVNETSVKGIRSVAVLGELKGLWELHQRHGSLPWRTLIQPSIDLCRNGHIVTRYLAGILRTEEGTIKGEKSLAEVFINPATNKVWIEGDLIKRPKLAETLELMANEGADTLYNNGTLAQLLVADIQQLGGILTIEDFMDYNVRWEDAISTTFLGNTVHTVPLPGSGTVLLYVLNLLNGFLPLEKNVTFYQRIVEAFKYAYAKRSELADPYYAPGVIKTFQQMLDRKFVADIRSKIEDDRTYQDYAHYGANFSMPDDHGTAHISVVAPNGDAIAVTTTINTLFGAKIISKSTGMILNDQMDDFSTPGKVNTYGVPASPANYIKPGKRPLSSTCPSIVIDANGELRLVVGGAGGSRITTTVAYVTISYLLFGSLPTAVSESHFHHQLAPMYMEYEAGFNRTILQGLSNIGHDVRLEQTTYGFVTVTAIAREGPVLIPAVDPKKSGSAFVF